MSFCGFCGSTTANCQCDWCEECSHLKKYCQCEPDVEFGDEDLPEDNERARFEKACENLAKIGKALKGY